MSWSVRAHAQTQTSLLTPHTDAPGAYCVQRFLSPFVALAGDVPVTEPGSDPATPLADWLLQVEAAGAQLRAALSTPGHPAALEVAIATVPDPIDSGSVYQFETIVQAIRAGYEEPITPSARYFRDRSFSPWDDREVATSHRATSEACRTSTPGVLLFRTSALEDPRALAVLLVGETPTQGLHTATLINALQAAERLMRGAAGSSDGTSERAAPLSIRVIGPAFSGSAHSLRLGLRAFAQSDARGRALGSVRIISGTATGSDVPALLLHNPDQGLPIEYFATTVPEYAVDCAYLWFLHKQLSVDRDETGVLQGVATLHESGTEFGATGVTYGDDLGRCFSRLKDEPARPMRAAVSLTFPVHVSFLRDAYEDLDRRDAKLRDDGISRATSLEASLHEPRQPLDPEANPSEKTRAVMDIALNSVLAEISRRAIQHVGIHATNIGDAIFLARKIRDIAPDVRLAFFEPDAILLHPQFRPALLGSLAVSSYPFLGVNDFKTPDDSKHLYRAFTSAAAQGVFNAVMAQRDVPHYQLNDYTFDTDEQSPLPVWVSTIGRNGFVPRHVAKTRDFDCTVYGNQRMDDACRTAEDKEFDYQKFNTIRTANLPIDPGLLLPNFWNFLFMALLFAFAIDWGKQARTGRRLACDLMPESTDATEDQQADRAIGRTKWWLYAAIRRFVFVLGFGYMEFFYILAFAARGNPRMLLGFLLTLCGLAVIAAGVLCWDALRRFGSDYRAFARYVDGHLVPLTWNDLRDGFRSGRLSSTGIDSQAASEPTRLRWTERFSLSFAIQPLGRTAAARVSFAQLRLVACSTAALAGFFLVCLILNAQTSTGPIAPNAGIAPAWTMTVLRNVPLFNGISAATPALLSLCCVYVWAVGRMARLALAHNMSRISPADGESDLVSTPIRLVLYPRDEQGTYDEGFTRAERDLLNAIWRPITGRYYTVAFFSVLFFPAILFYLKPLSTLENFSGTLLLAGGLALSAVLIGVTLIQLMQYWVRLERVLKRTMAHPLGPVFGQLPPYVRDSVDHQVSRSPNELLRWVACARQFGDLFAASHGIDDATCLDSLDPELGHFDVSLRARAKLALTMAEAPDAAGTEEIQLAECVIASAAQVTRTLERVWTLARERPATRSISLAPEPVANQQLDLLMTGTGQVYAQPRETTPAELDAAAPLAAESVVSRPSALPDALEPVSYRFGQNELRWLRQAQVYVATVSTLLIHKHVRQFRYFVSTLTVASLLLLLIVTSYPFEPYRLLLTCIWTVVGTVVGTGLWVYIQLDRNTLISLMSGTAPNRVTVDRAFVLRVLAWAVVPLLSVAAAQYPDLGHLLYQIIAPFTPSLK